MPRISTRPPKKIQQRQLELRARLWPGLNQSDLWNRLTHDGFSTIPSSMPLIMSIIDDLSNGRPASMTYLDLWTRAFDEGFVTLAKPREMAFHAGFTTQRAERTWKQKLDVLAELNFIDLKSGPSGPASYALIWNPYVVIKWHHDQKAIGLREDKFNALVARSLELGDRTFAPPAPPLPPQPVMPLVQGVAPPVPPPWPWPQVPSQPPPEGVAPAPTQQLEQRSEGVVPGWTGPAAGQQSKQLVMAHGVAPPVFVAGVTFVPAIKEDTTESTET
jgi:hypothetical protein